MGSYESWGHGEKLRGTASLYGRLDSSMESGRPGRRLGNLQLAGGPGKGRPWLQQWAMSWGLRTIQSDDLFVHFVSLTERSEVEVKLYHCTECDECFTDPSDFSFHQKAHGANHRFSCAICRLSFESESTFLKHQSCHLDRPSSPCVGERSFLVRSTIVRYSGEKPFQCTDCGRCFALKSTLVKHQRVHTGERPFVCGKCGRSFSQSCNLLRHERRCAAAKVTLGLN